MLKREVRGMKSRLRSFRTLIALSLVLTFVSVFLPPSVSASASQLIFKGSTSVKVVALTFDDCSSTSNISAVLDTLNSNGIKATFFVNGENAAAHPSSIRSISNSGMEIGNHSYNHLDLTTISYGRVQNEIRRSDTAIANVIGKSTKPLFRPPYGAYSSNVLNAAGDAGFTKTIMWNVDPQDWSGVSANTIYSRVVNNVTPGSIVLMHCNYEAANTRYALQRIIDTLSSRGYSFATVSQLLAGSRGSFSRGYTGTTSTTVSSDGILRLGSTGAEVTRLQQALVSKGYSLVVDGEFGPITQNAVMSFQRSVGILVDGEVGPVTWSKLGTSSGTYSSSSTSYPGLLKIGSSGTAVRTLQQALVNRGYSLSVDGVFGPITQSAVMSFQRSQGITVDGIVGPVTWGRLF